MEGSVSKQRYCEEAQCAHHFYPVCGQPVEHFEKQQTDKEYDERSIELFAEYSEGQETLRDCVPCSFMESLRDQTVSARSELVQ